MYQVRTLKAHDWQGRPRKVGDVYDVDERDPCTEGARVLGLTERIDAAVEPERAQPRRRRPRKNQYQNRALTA